MKTFRHGAGHVCSVTMTVGEIKEKLGEYPDDMAVFPMWEGIHTQINLESFLIIEDYDCGHKGDTQSVLEIDVDQA